MRDAKPGTIFLKDYQPPAYFINRTELDFELHEDHALETATLHLARQPQKIASGVSSELALGFGSELKEDDLAPYDAEQAEWCEKVLEEIEALEELDFEIEFKTLPKAAPLFFAQLKSAACIHTSRCWWAVAFWTGREFSPRSPLPS